MPDFSAEMTYIQQGKAVAGVDEAGRGPWAGPLVVAAVRFRTIDAIPKGINDSKKLNATRRDGLFDQIIACADVGIAIIDVEMIDSINILKATDKGMIESVAKLKLCPQALLIDGNRVPPGMKELTYETQSIVEGDASSLSIGAASIIAKVTRDRMMQALSLEFPHYGWDRNAGYGTPWHQEAITRFGITPHHRRSFAPIRRVIEAEAMAQSA
ncbi:MAG: rnhB [Rickettsiales bacterium]|nr:rnhB [Rickettsiales bacterium]